MSVAIKTENLSKAYQLGQIGTGTLQSDLKRWYAKTRGKEDPFLKIGETNDRAVKGTTNVVWSLKDISFEIEQGDAVGIIGRNGAGKSTLLKILSRVTTPTTGTITGNGRIASLLEVGTGFHPELTGKENIYLNGAILGMRKKEIKRKFDAIVDFAGVDRYIDTPVKRYSSGMYVRLAFAVAAYLESEILIVDEVLAVGDAEFQKKCLGKMNEVSKGEGRTVLFVSHNMEAILKLCKQVLVLKNGLLNYIGNSKSGVKSYQQFIDTKNSDWTNVKQSFFPQIKHVSSKVYGKQPNLKLLVKIIVGSNDKFPSALIAIDIKNSIDMPVTQAIPTSSPFIKFIGQDSIHEIEIDLIGLIPDFYTVSVWIGPHNNETYDWVREVVAFEIIESPIENRTFPHSHENGYSISNSKIS